MFITQNHLVCHHTTYFSYKECSSPGSVVKFFFSLKVDRTPKNLADEEYYVGSVVFSSGYPKNFSAVLAVICLLINFGQMKE